MFSSWSFRAGPPPPTPATADPADRGVGLILGSVGVLLLLLAPLFRSLTVRVDATGVAARYGPVPLFRRKLPFSEIESAEPGRSLLIDGLGIHYVPGRGWTWNLWSRSCVELRLQGGRTWRIGSPEPEALAAAIEARRESDAE